MQEYSDKNKQNQQSAERLSTKESRSEPSVQFSDNRSQASVQRKIKEAAQNASPLGGFQDMRDPAVSYNHTVQKKENNTGLPNNLKAGVEQLSGYAVDDVKVHYNSDKPAQLNAHAFAQGSDIHVAPGQEQHLPHEAWHVIQQKQGRVKPTVQMKQGVAVNDDAGLEQEADVMGSKAVQMKPEETSRTLIQSNAVNVAQLLSDEDIPKAGHHLFNNIIKDFADALQAGLTSLSPYLGSFNNGAVTEKSWKAVLDVLATQGQDYENTGRHEDLRVYKHLGRPKGMNDTNSVLHGLMREYFINEFSDAAYRALMSDGVSYKEGAGIEHVWEEVVNQSVDREALADYAIDPKKNQGLLAAAVAERQTFLSGGKDYIRTFFYQIDGLKNKKVEYENAIGDTVAIDERKPFAPSPQMAATINTLAPTDQRAAPANNTSYPGGGIHVPSTPGVGAAKTVPAVTISSYLTSNGWVK